MMLATEQSMGSDQNDKIEELATQLDDLADTVEELEVELTGRDAERLEGVREALEHASDTTDQLIIDHDA